MKVKGLKIAHRGIFDNKEIPENSLSAFRKARALGIPIEFDVQVTKDNIVIVFHDISLKRMCNINGYVENYTYEELKEVFLLNTSEHIPTLYEVLNLIKGEVLIDIELKQTNNYKNLCSLVLQQLGNYQGKVLLKSFHPNIVRYLKKKSSFYIGLLLTDYPTSKLYSYLISSSFLIHYCNPDFIAVNKKLVKKKRLQKWRTKKSIFVWTIYDNQELQLFLPYADNYLCNNLPYKK